jgi:hypothetical protein
MPHPDKVLPNTHDSDWQTSILLQDSSPTNQSGNPPIKDDDSRDFNLISVSQCDHECILSHLTPTIISVRTQPTIRPLFLHHPMIFVSTVIVSQSDLLGAVWALNFSLRPKIKKPMNRLSAYPISTIRLASLGHAGRLWNRC